jgi:cellulose synthase/poly-beta-1,6-N-acetylglucosamine synthase-like glycosyltransferase
LPGDILTWIGIVGLLGLSVVLLIFIFGFWKGREVLDASIEYRDVSILIPFRNENKIHDQFIYLKELLSGTGIKVYWVDDFSDNLPLVFEKATETEPDFKLIQRQTGKPGKKEAIAFGMRQINTEWVLMMDADTRPQSGFFSKGALAIASRWKMILLPLFPDVSNKTFRIFFDLEFIVLQLVTHASAILGYPLLANGAALLVKRADYLETLDARRDFHIASGDDLFALFAFLSKFGRRSIGSAAHLIEPFRVSFPSSLQALWRQRLRWVSKTGQVKSTYYLIVSFLVVLANLSFIGLATYFLCKPGKAMVAWALLAYLISSVSFLFVAISFAKRWRLTPYLIPAIFVYPFYLSALLLASAIVKPKWK